MCSFFETIIQRKVLNYVNIQREHGCPYCFRREVLVLCLNKHNKYDVTVGSKFTHVVHVVH